MTADVVGHGPARGGSAVRHADLGIDVLDVVFGGPCGDEQLGSDLSGRAVCGNEAEHVDLAPAQTTWASAARPRSGVAAGSVDLAAGIDGGIEIEARAGHGQLGRFGRTEPGGEPVPELGKFGDVVEA